MADQDLKLYPTGQIGFGSGNLKEATLGRWSFVNGANLRHSLAKTPSGFTLGNKEVTGSIEFEVSETGLERSVVDDVENGQRRNFRFKDATDTYEIQGVINQVDWETSRGDAIRVVANFIGKLVI